MSELVIDFQWERSSYEVVAEIPDRLRGAPIIGSKSSRLGFLLASQEPKTFRPTAKDFDLAVQTLLAITAGVRKHTEPWQPPDDVVEVVRPRLHAAVPKLARKLGQLGMLGPVPKESLGVEDLMTWYLLAESLTDMFEFAEKPGATEYTSIFAQFEIVLIPKNGEIAVALRPPTMFVAIMAHGARMITGGAALPVCQACSMPFLSGGGRSRGKKKAGSAFCSDQCRWNYNNAKRKKRPRILTPSSVTA